MSRKGSTVIVQGLVTASDWDHEGNPTEVMICSSGEIDYVVKSDNKGERLLGKLRENVIVEGFLTETDFGKLISIKSILRRNEND